MESIQIKNLKSISDSGIMQIKPLTIFVGRNSSGKSSIVRSFPLLKQSAELKTLGTVLWSGKYVDFGSFSESINHNASQSEIEFSFAFKSSRPRYQRLLIQKESHVQVTISVHGDEYIKKSYTRFTFELLDNKISIEYSSDLKVRSMIINGEDFTRQFQEHWIVFKSYSLIPILADPEAGKRKRELLYNEIKKHLNSKTSDKKIFSIIRMLGVKEDNLILKTLSTRSITGAVGASKMAQWDTKNEDFKKIRNLNTFLHLEPIIDSISDYLHDYFLNCRYITPLRAAADRYYRIQNVSIEALDPNGSNLAMFLRAKSETEIEELNEWLSDEIGFKIELKSSLGHTSIFIIGESNDRSNIADSGFGYSQILPILIQIWDSAKSGDTTYRRTSGPTTIVIEQPELHLHPKMQSRLGTAFCKAMKIAKDNGFDLRILIETHSKDIIDAVGRAIDQKVISEHEVSIYLVDKESQPCVKESSYDSDGYLLNWPYGFLEGA